ncbi:DMT family transporter [Iamia sp. SCSIO 61187]|uniref:DMT family transporter n=1 Tax=Iamia sp. SCSIO 61187 TaxID=2722752 RepID=UPI001C6364EC|nr:DMT family transporter [Iamia sp. SCSIO 61187]QYG91894.1 DMT family transporter [Iamia sp. SCSIO 61187]
MVGTIGTGVARCGLAAVLFGATTPLAAELAGETSAPVLAGLLYVGAAVAVAPVVARQGLDPLAIRRGGSRLLAAVVAGGLLGPVLLVAGLDRTPAATASLLLNLELVATTVLAAVFFHEHVGRRVASGTALVVVAGAALAWVGAPELRVGALLVVAACVCWGVDNCVTADLDQISPAAITLVKGVVAGGTNLVLGLALGGSVPSGWGLPAALVIGMLGFGASITLWVRGARDLGAARGQLVFSTAPFVGVAVAWGVLGDRVRPVEVVALVLAAVGVTRVVGSDHAHDHVHHPVEHDHEHRHDDGHHDHVHPDLPPDVTHAHRHGHGALVHAHPHVPDLHHRHEH